MFDINNLVTDLNSHVSFCGGGGGGGGDGGGGNDSSRDIAEGISRSSTIGVVSKSSKGKGAIAGSGFTINEPIHQQHAKNGASGVAKGGSGGTSLPGAGVTELEPLT